MTTTVEWKITGLHFPDKAYWMVTATNDAGAMRSITGVTDISVQTVEQSLDGLSEMTALSWVFDALGEQVRGYEQTVSEAVEGQPAINAETYKQSKLPWEK
jgi:hypothetical protein